MGERPFIKIDAAVNFGGPSVGSNNAPVEAVAGMRWAGESVETVCDEYGISRPDLLVAAWYLGTYGQPRWRKRWGYWAKKVYAELWSRRYEVPDPPVREETSSHG